MYTILRRLHGDILAQLYDWGKSTWCLICVMGLGGFALCKITQAELRKLRNAIDATKITQFA